jgi:hypothetical protein
MCRESGVPLWHVMRRYREVGWGLVVRREGGVL